MDTQNPKSKSDPPASPQRNQSETKPVPDTPPASPSTFASFFGFGESPSKPPNEESNKPPATEILAAASSSDDHSESGRDETETMRPLTDPAPVAFTNVEDAGGTGRRLYDADEADGAMATLRTELDHRSTQIGQLQDGVRRLMEQMSRVQSEKESVESVATDLTEKNASLQSKVIARVVHLMRNASTAKSFRTWRDVTQSEKISRAGAEKTAALMRASTDEFKVAKLTDEVEELRTRLEEATERAESAETKAATAEKWAAEAEVRVSFYFRFRRGD
jgi:predicted  nucleic acid-binding Zn-ribbon protein